MKRLQLFLMALRVPVDFLALVLAGWGAYLLRYSDVYSAVRPVLTLVDPAAYWGLVLRVAALWVVIFAFSGLYTSRRLWVRTEMRRVVLGCSAGVVALIAFMFWNMELFSSRFIVLVAWALSIIFVAFGRLAIRGLERLLAHYGHGVAHVVVIGVSPISATMMEWMMRNKHLGLRVVGQFARWDTVTAEQVIALRNAGSLHSLLLADPQATKEMAYEVLDFAERHHLGFAYSADLLQTATKNFDFTTYAGIPVIEYKPTRLEGWGRIYKRTFDIAGSLALIVLTAPIMAMIALAIKLDSRGPVLFSQLRVGAGGKSFRYFKFRSMRVGAELEQAALEALNERSGTPMFKMKNDPRVTRVGRFIRKTSLDELPEFFLVLLGRMSLVGPRPHLPSEVARYAAHHHKVLNVKPGITGLAQVSGRADLHFEDEVKLDLFYMENWSPWLDLFLLVKTPLAIFGKRGAY